jgi:hypothetical protein
MSSQSVIALLKGLEHHKLLGSWSPRLGLDWQCVYHQQVDLPWPISLSHSIDKFDEMLRDAPSRCVDLLSVFFGWLQVPEASSE